MGRKKRYNYSKRAKDFKDDPKEVRRDRATRHQKEPWEALKIPGYTRKNRKDKGTHKVKGHIRSPPHPAHRKHKVFTGPRGGLYYYIGKGKNRRRVYL